MPENEPVAPIRIKIEHRPGRRDCIMEHGKPTAWQVTLKTEWSDYIFIPLCEECYEKLRRFVRDAPPKRDPSKMTDIEEARNTAAPLGVSVTHKPGIGNCSMIHGVAAAWVFAIDTTYTSVFLVLCESCFAKLRYNFAQEYPKITTLHPY